MGGTWSEETNQNRGTTQNDFTDISKVNNSRSNSVDIPSDDARDSPNEKARRDLETRITKDISRLKQVNWVLFCDCCYNITTSCTGNIIRTLL